MSPKTKKIVKFVVRWGIAVAGIGWVIGNISIYNRVLVQDPTTLRAEPARLVGEAREDDRTFRVIDPFSETRRQIEVPREQLLVKSDRDKVKIRDEGNVEREVEVVGLKVSDSTVRESWPLVVAKPRTFWMKYTGSNWGDRPETIDPSRIVGDYHISVPYPVIETGLGPMTRLAMQNKPLFLLAALFVFPVTYLITSYRWHMLLKCLQIGMTVPRTFVINMVGAFYNTFLPGSTGGDVLKAYYAAKQTTQYRTRAVMSVLVDRILGLLALVILGGTMAAYQFFTSPVHDAAWRKCGQVALGSALIIFATVSALVLYYNGTLRRISGLDFLIRRLPMQAQVHKAMDTMEIYRIHWAKVLIAIGISIPVHATVVLSAMFAGMAFGLPMHWSYYWVAVPVIVLSGSIPISPQGAGVMEFFAILLTRSQGVTISQAFALTMSIRMVQILWNLMGGIFVLRGGFHAPTSAEEQSLTSDDETPTNGGGQVPQPQTA